MTAYLTFPAKVFFYRGQRAYNHFCYIMGTTFLRMLIGLAPRREIFLFHEIYTQHSLAQDTKIFVIT